MEIKSATTPLSRFDLKRKINELYKINATNCHLLLDSLSEVYLIETKSSKYILKLYSQLHTNATEVKGEIELLNKLHQRAVNVAYPIRAKNGRQLFHLTRQQGSAIYAVLYSCAIGNVFYQMTEKQVAAVSREIATMHNITEGLQLKNQRKRLNLDNLLISPIVKIKGAFQDLPQEYQFLCEMAKKMKEKIDLADLNQCSYGYCHYDLLPNNFHFDDEDKVTFFDFELSGEGYLINDLVSFYAHYFLQVVHGRITQQEAKRAFFLLIKNYTKIRPLTTTELEVFPYFGFAFWIFHMAFDLEHFTDRSHAGYLQQQVAYIRSWIEWYINI
jgi:Ser/Thr protein kinase RdoA (MazF antagonist)